MKPKSCPFCGGNATFGNYSVFNGTMRYVMCEKCTASTKVAPTLEEAIRNWNRRTEPPNLPLTLDELREIDGEPVWTERYGWQICHGIQSVNGILSMDVGNGVFLSVQTYGLEWLAYRRRTEDKTT